MAKKLSDRIDDLLHTMDAHDLLNVLRVLQADVGDRRLLDALESVASSKADFDPEDVASQASECSEMDEREWYSMATDDGYGGYIDSAEHAVELMLDNLRDAFQNDLRQILASGGEESASEFLLAIADGFRESSGILAEEAEDFISEFSDHLEECAERRDFDNVFRW
ncbi:MAG: hypothetical protein MJZ38_00560 [archaeon]|nr:hypothetical protein [archaeon]